MRLFLIFMLFCQLSAPALAQEWSRGDFAREAVYLAAHTADWAQTLQIARTPDRYWEINPVLGEHPSRDKVNLFFVTSLLAHLFITNALSDDYRTTWQLFTMSVEVGLVSHNYNIGLKARF